ncbi:glucose-6-phosphate dehydrogenase (coenzyme-F420), partial [Rhodococcus jostii]
ALPIEQVAKRWIVASDPDEAVAQIRPYLDAGLNHLVFHAPGHDQKRFLELFERDLAPRLRELASPPRPDATSNASYTTGQSVPGIRAGTKE